MALLTRLDSVRHRPWLARLESPGRSWWELRDGPRGDTADALTDLVERSGRAGDVAWAAVLEGSRDRLRYVAEASGAGTGPQGGETRWAVAPLTTEQALAILDATETGRVDVLLLQAPGNDAARLVAELSTAAASAGTPLSAPPAPPGALAEVPLVISRRVGQTRAEVGVLGDLPPDMSGAVVGATAPVGSATGAGWSGAGVVSASAAPAPARRRAAAALLLAVAVVAGGSWLAFGRRGAPTPTPTRSHTAAPNAVLPSLDPGGQPSPAQQPAFAYDPVHRATVLFGGLGAGPSTWLWANGRWRAARTPVSPPDSFGGAMAYDPKLNKVLLFGGRQARGELLTDTWGWDGTTWAQLAAAPGPPGWEFAGMTWDEAHQEMVLVTPPPAGVSGGAVETWTWADHGWVRRSTTVAPPSEPSTAMAFDPVTGTVVLALGGLSTDATPSTWSWDGVGWRALQPLHEPDLGGFVSYLARVPGAAQLLLARVSVDPPQMLETWIWDGHDWVGEKLAAAPSGTLGLVSDIDRGVVAYAQPIRGRPLDGGWTWTGATWRHG